MNEHSVDETNNAQEQEEHKVEDPELRRLLVPNPEDLPLTPPSSVEANFVSYFAPGSSSCIYSISQIWKQHNCFSKPKLSVWFPDFMKPGHDQYIYRHANG